MSINARELRARRADLLKKAAEMVEAAEIEDRDLTDAEQGQYDEALAQAEALEARAQRYEQIGGIAKMLETRQAPAFNRSKLGDDPNAATERFIRFGDAGALGGAVEQRGNAHQVEIRASNDTDMNIGTAADGGNAVPTGHYNQIVARRDEARISTRLGVTTINLPGTTANVPFDNEADGEFVSTAEAAGYDRDAPALGQAAMTLVKYTKKVELSVELLQDEASNLMPFLSNFVGRGMAKTHNNLLITEAAATGTSLKTFASATAIAAGELEDIIGDDNLDAYLDDSGSVAWVMRNSVRWEILKLLGNNRIYEMTPIGPGLLGFPVVTTVKSGQTVASAKSVYLGNWSYMYLREEPSFTLLRDPYTLGHLGQVRLLYMFRAVYKQVIAEAIGYGVHPSA